MVSASWTTDPIRRWRQKRKYKMRILVISSTYPPYHGGGYGLLCQRHAEALAHRGHDVSVLTTMPASRAEGEPASSSVPVIRRLLPIPHGSRPAQLLIDTLRNRR